MNNNSLRERIMAAQRKAALIPDEACDEVFSDCDVSSHTRSPTPPPTPEEKKYVPTLKEVSNPAETKQAIVELKQEMKQAKKEGASKSELKEYRDLIKQFQQLFKETQRESESYLKRIKEDAEYLRSVKREFDRKQEYDNSQYLAFKRTNLFNRL